MRAWPDASRSLEAHARSQDVKGGAMYHWMDGWGWFWMSFMTVFWVVVLGAVVYVADLLPARVDRIGRGVVRSERQLAGLEPVRGGGAFDERDRLVGAAAQLQLPGDDLAGAAVDDRHQVRPAVLGDPDARHVELPELPGPLDPEEAGTLPAFERSPALDQLPLPHHARHTRQGVALGDQTAGPGDAHAHSQPASAFTAISNS